MRTIGILSCLLVAIASCTTRTEGTGASTSSGTHATGAGGAGGAGGWTTTSGTAGPGGDLNLGGLGSGGSGGAGGCSAASQLVYVFALDNHIYSFDPPSKQFTMLATPDCPTAAQANSMAIDRNLVAWLNYIGGLYTFDLKTLSGCQKFADLPAGFTQVGMGFSTDAAGGAAETLYLDSIGGGGLARVDMAAKAVVPIGTFANDAALTGRSAELTGTGDARLFGYFTTSPYVRVAEIDKGTAAIVSDDVLNGVTPPADWAFTFWGGDFYLYAAPGTNATGNSSVIKYSPATKNVDPTYVADTGMKIVGAGVSTCAPTKPPS
jgi:hypothetical protein